MMQAAMVEGHQASIRLGWELGPVLARRGAVGDVGWQAGRVIQPVCCSLSAAVPRLLQHRGRMDPVQPSRLPHCPLDGVLGAGRSGSSQEALKLLRRSCRASLVTPAGLPACGPGHGDADAQQRQARRLRHTRAGARHHDGWRGRGVRYPGSKGGIRRHCAWRAVKQRRHGCNRGCNSECGQHGQDWRGQDWRGQDWCGQDWRCDERKRLRPVRRCKLPQHWLVECCRGDRKGGHGKSSRKQGGARQRANAARQAAADGQAAAQGAPTKGADRHAATGCGANGCGTERGAISNTAYTASVSRDCMRGTRDRWDRPGWQQTARSLRAHRRDPACLRNCGPSKARVRCGVMKLMTDAAANQVVRDMVEWPGDYPHRRLHYGKTRSEHRLGPPFQK